MTFAYAAEALSSDAKLWDGIGDALATMKGVVDGLDIPRGAFTFAGGDAATAYESLRALVAETVQEGATQTHGAATALREIRTAYESTETSIQATLTGLWEPQE